MIKIAFEYTIVGVSVVKVTPTITEDASTVVQELIMAEAIRTLTMDNIKKTGLVKDSDISSILSHIGKE